MKVITDLKSRIKSLIKIGLHYLSLNREISTLSVGESQRLKLTRIIESGLTGVLYIIDEPTTALHPSDIKLILSILNNLKDKGNSVWCIEHNLDVITKSDYIIELGTGGGTSGGQIIYRGPLDKILDSDSIIKKYF